jgi:hypothetical protein
VEVLIVGRGANYEGVCQDPPPPPPRVFGHIWPPSRAPLLYFRPVPLPIVLHKPSYSFRLFTRFYGIPHTFIQLWGFTESGHFNLKDVLFKGKYKYLSLFVNLTRESGGSIPGLLAKELLFHVLLIDLFR